MSFDPDDMPREGDTPDETRARMRRWAMQDPDPYWRRQLWLASLTPRQRLNRWWRWNWPIAVPLIVAAALAALALCIDLVIY